MKINKWEVIGKAAVKIKWTKEPVGSSVSV